VNVVDPVCKRQFEQGRARRCEMVLGRMHYFCSNACHNQFLANLGRFAGQGGTTEHSTPRRV
jgi:YHS domain-containing protein